MGHVNFQENRQTEHTGGAYPVAPWREASPESRSNHL